MGLILSCVLTTLQSLKHGKFFGFIDFADSRLLPHLVSQQYLYQRFIAKLHEKRIFLIQIYKRSYTLISNFSQDYFSYL